MTVATRATSRRLAVPRLMNDVVRGDEIRQRVQHDFVDRGRSLRASHDENGRSRRVEFQEFIPAFFCGQFDLLAYRMTCLGDAITDFFGEFDRGFGMCERDPFREFGRPERYATWRRVGVVDRDGDLQEFRRIQRRERGISAA